MNIRESVLNYVKATLDPSIWDLESGKLQKSIREQILGVLNRESHIAEVPFTENWRVYIIGSITGKQYVPQSDIDVTVEVGQTITDEELQKLATHFVHNVNGRPAIDTVHPINYFFRRDFVSRTVDGAYDVMRDEWIAEPGEIAPFDPEKEFKNQFGTGKRVAMMVVQVFEELLRDLTDLEELGEVSDGFYDKKYWSKSMEVWYDINILTQMYRQIHTARKEQFEKGVEVDPQKSMENIVYKFLERYGYLEKLHFVVDLRKQFFKALNELRGGK